MLASWGTGTKLSRNSIFIFNYTCIYLILLQVSILKRKKKLTSMGKPKILVNGFLFITIILGITYRGENRWNPLMRKWKILKSFKLKEQKKMSKARDTNFFTKNFTNCWCGEWLLINEKVMLMMDLDENL